MGLLIKLQNGDTALKSLKFGNDRPGGGDSGQPYIKTPIDKPDIPTLNNDFLLRGGISAPLDAAEDVARLTKYFFDLRNPSGLLFTAKQNLLSRTGTKTESSRGLGYGFGSINEGIYTPLSTIAEAGVVAFGGHLNKQGIDPTGLLPFLAVNKYQDTIKLNQLLGRINLESNRLVALTNAISQKKGISNFGFVQGYNLNTNGSLISYGGGPDSILGIGNTNISFATDNLGNPIKTLLTKPSDYLVGKQEVAIDRDKFQLPIQASSLYNQLIKSFSTQFVPYDLTKDGLTSYQENFNSSVYITSPTGSSLTNDVNVTGYGTWLQPEFMSQSLNVDGETKEDFRTILPPDYVKTFSGTPYTKANNIETLFNLGNPGQKGDLSNYKAGKILPGRTKPERALDTVNYSYIYKSNTGQPQDDPLLYDLIPFRIAILNNEKQLGGVYRKYIHFRAFINGFSDSYGADWDKVSYMGRAEKFYKYGGFNRDISIGFTIVAQSVQELTPMYDKLNFLASSLAPEYLDASTSGYMAGNIAYMTVGDYLSEQPGIITSLDFDIPDDTTWEVATNRDGTIDADPRELRRLPHRIEVKMKFTPIHKFRPQKQTFQEDIGNTTSTRLLKPGVSKYIDQLRPETTNYDKEGSTGNNAPDAPAQSLTTQNTIPQYQVPPEITDSSALTSNQGTEVTGLGGNSSFNSNTIFP